MIDERIVGRPLVGVVTCRPYRRGDDAAAAIKHLGRLAGGLGATHLLVLWEEADLRTSLHGPADTYPQGLVLVQATYCSHQLDWHPFTYQVRGQRPSGGADLDISWGQPTTCPGAALPSPIQHLLSWFRLPEFSSRDEVDRTLQAAADNGYDFSVFLDDRGPTGAQTSCTGHR